MPVNMRVAIVQHMPVVWSRMAPVRVKPTIPNRNAGRCTVVAVAVPPVLMTPVWVVPDTVLVNPVPVTPVLMTPVWVVPVPPVTPVRVAPVRVNPGLTTRVPVVATLAVHRTMWTPMMAEAGATLGTMKAKGHLQKRNGSSAML